MITATYFEQHIGVDNSQKPFEPLSLNIFFAHLFGIYGQLGVRFIITFIFEKLILTKIYFLYHLF